MAGRCQAAGMTLRIVGAGIGRTGTNSLKVALERLLGEMEVVPSGLEQWHGMGQLMMTRFAPGYPDEGACKAAYEQHNAEVRAAVPADRLIDWQPSDGWGPLCGALDVPVPDEPFPRTNSMNEFRARFGREPIPDLA